MQSRDRCLEREAAVASRGDRRIRETSAQQLAVPRGPVDLVERQRDTGGVDASGTACQSEPHDGPESAHLRVLGEQGHQRVGDGQCLAAHVRQCVRGLEAGPVGDGEHAGDAVEDHRQPDQALGGLRHPELAACVGQCAFRAGQPRGRRTLLDAAVHGRLGDAQPTDHAQHQDHPGPGRQRLVARDEQQRHAVVEALGHLVGVLHGSHHLSGRHLGGDPAEHATATVVVDPGALGHAHAPCGEILDVVVVHGAGHRLGGVLLGVVKAA